MAFHHHILKTSTILAAQHLDRASRLGLSPLNDLGDENGSDGSGSTVRHASIRPKTWSKYSQIDHEVVPLLC